ncbi:MAG: hypothetical protein HY881_24930 [Deltaproteobacteria bacterium]|nr:hypothetical protein [Deltaproteobacteria bacterium]
MCKEVSEAQLRLLEEIEDPDELRRLLGEITGCNKCPFGRNPEPKNDDAICCIHHQMRFINRLFHIFKKIGL